MEGNLEVRKMSEGFGIALEMQIFKEDSVKLSESSVSSVSLPQLLSPSLSGIADSEYDEKLRGRRN